MSRKLIQPNFVNEKLTKKNQPIRFGIKYKDDPIEKIFEERIEKRPGGILAYYNTQIQAYVQTNPEYYDFYETEESEAVIITQSAKNKDLEK